MKRLMLVWVMVLCFIPLNGWAEETDSQPLISPFYQITESSDPTVGDSWKVISLQGNVLAEGKAPAYHSAPRLAFVEGSILCLRDAYLFTFYDVEQERVSDDYQYVIDMRGENVLYPELDLSSDDWAWRIVLADTFSGNIVRSVQIDLHAAECWVIDAEWVPETASWLITYLAGEEYIETTIIFSAVPEAGFQ